MAPSNDAGGRLERFRRRAALAVLIGLVSGGLGVEGLVAGAFQRAEFVSYDLRVDWTAGGWASRDRIVLLLIDEPSLAAVEAKYHEAWPWRRDFYKYPILYAARCGARAVVIDGLFPEHRPGDDALAAAIRSSPIPVVIGAASDPNGKDLDPETVSALERFDRRGVLRDVVPADRFVPPVASLLTAVQGIGDTTMRQDADGTSRRVSFLTPTRDGVYPSLALATFELAEKTGPAALHHGALVVAGRTLSRDADGLTALRFPDPDRLYPSIGFAGVLDSWIQSEHGETPTVEPEALRDKVVFVGASALGLKDVRRFPYVRKGGALPGVMLQAIAYDNLLHGFSVPPPSRTVGVISTLAVALAPPLAIELAPLVWGVPLALAVLASFFAASVAAFSYGIDLEMVAPLVAGGLSVVLAAGARYVTEGRSRLLVRRAFSHYLSESVMDRVLEDPDRFLRQWGERKFLTVLFMDFQGFTEVAERTDPDLLVESLNRYHGAATEIVFEHLGTLDKYVGDALIAFWGDPVDQPDQAARACRAALDIQKQLAVLRAEDEPRGRPALRARIGINSGEMIVGNMGSGRVFDYTVIGDNANLGARLESANKSFGTGIAISAATLEQAGPDFRVRELGRIRVKGRATPTQVFELRCLAPEDTEEERRLRALFADGVEAFRRRAWDDAEACFRAAGIDGASLRYLDEIAACRSAELEDDWDGVLMIA